MKAEIPSSNEDVENMPDVTLDRLEHYNAEMQTLMANMPPFLVPVYNELLMQLGWILFFSVVFPSGAMFTIFAGIIRMSIELRGMSEYKKKNEPQPIVDIGLYMDLMDFVSNLGILVCIYLIVFTSKELTKESYYDNHVMYLIAFGTLHCIFLLKYVLGELIEDEPGWITEDREMQVNRIDQI